MKREVNNKDDITVMKCGSPSYEGGYPVTLIILNRYFTNTFYLS